MFKFLYVVYGAIVLVASTVMNLNYMDRSSGGSGWSSHSSGSSYGGSGMGGGYSGGGHHK